MSRVGSKQNETFRGWCEIKKEVMHQQKILSLKELVFNQQRKLRRTLAFRSMLNLFLCCTNVNPAL